MDVSLNLYLRRSFYLGAIVLASFLSSCSDDGDEIIPQEPIDEEPVVDIDDPLAAQLENLLGDEVMGYAYSVLRNGALVHEGEGGLARNEADGGIAMTVFTPMHVASISKFITTVATIKLLDEYQIPLDSSVEAFFPDDWEIGPGIDNLSFLELISQQAGLNHYGTNRFDANVYDSLKFIVAAGAEQGKFRFYNNNHHSLMRVILPVLDDMHTGAINTYTPVTTGLLYEDLVNRLLFEPYGITAGLNASPLGVARAYTSANDNNAGSGAFIDFTQVGAAYGWHISVADLTTLWQKVWHTEEIIDAEVREVMKENFAGLFDSFSRNGDFYYVKTGLWWYSFSTEQQIQTVAIHFPDNVDVILFTNSAHQGYGHIANLVIQAYDNSLLPG